MRARKPLHISLFILDALRLAAILTALSSYQTSSSELGNFGSYAIAYAAPQTLFLLISFFLWRSPLDYKPFLPLYTAGKTISAIAVGSWLLRVLPSAALALGLGNTGTLNLLGVSAIVVVLDLLTVLFALLLSLSQAKPVHGSKENRADLVVESIDDDPSSVGAK